MSGFRVVVTIEETVEHTDGTILRYAKSRDFHDVYIGPWHRLEHDARSIVDQIEEDYPFESMPETE